MVSHGSARSIESIVMKLQSRQKSRHRRQSPPPRNTTPAPSPSSLPCLFPSYISYLLSSVPLPLPCPALHSLPAALIYPTKQLQTQLGGLGSAVCSPRPQKHFWNILSPEVVSVATMLVVFFAPTSFLDKLAFEKSASMF